MTRGYVALFSALVIATTLTISTFVLNEEVFYARSALTHEENYRAAQFAAESCASIAIHTLSTVPDRFLNTPPISVPLHGTTCIIQKVSSTKTDATVLVTGYFGTSAVPVEVQAHRASSSVPFLITSYKER